jgi:O-antigen/teichoic acid export membrane protein
MTQPPSTALPRVPEPTPASRPRSAEAEDLIRRAPMGYVWNQMSSLWLFISSFLFTILAAHSLGTNAYGGLVIALTTYNTAVYVAAFGLEDATSVFLPRNLAEQGRAAAAVFIRRTVLTRVIGLAIVIVALAGILPPLATLLASFHWIVTDKIANAIVLPGFNTFALPLVAYIFGTGLSNQLTSIYTSLLRTQIVFIVGALAQTAMLVGVFVALRLNMGIVGVLWASALAAWGGALLLFVLLAPWWSYRGPPPATPPYGQVLRLGSSAWIINLINGALFKQMAIWLLVAYALTKTIIGYFNLAYQLTDAAAALLISGLGGVGLAAMSAAYSGQDRRSLAFAWRAVSKAQILLAVPLLTFVIIHAQTIATALYGAQYAPVGPLMQLFLVFNIAQRLAGGGAHQAALYVLGRQRLALITQVSGLALTVVLGIILIPLPGMFGGPAGMLIALGVSRVAVEGVQLALAWRFLQSKYPLRFGLRVCLGLIPAIGVALWLHPSNWGWLPTHIGGLHISATLVALVISVLLFTVVLVIGLAIAKPMEHEDVDLLAQTNPRLRPILTPFASGAPSPRMLISKMTTRPIAEATLNQSLTPTTRRTRANGQPIVRMPVDPQKTEE